LKLPEERADRLKELQRRKMARSAQTYVRGATVRFYQWLTQDDRALPEGPPVWICGDCHYGNLGPVANAKGEVALQIRDLDQTVIGNPAHDLIRLAFSLASAARGFDLPGITTARLVEQAVDGYLDALAAEPTEAPDQPPLIRGLLRASRQRSWRHLARERIGDLEPSIPLGKRFWPLSDDERGALRALIADARIRDLITSLHSRPSDAGIKLVDAAYWVKGCSSLGLLRYAVLVEIDGGKTGELSLIDVKEATKARAPRSADQPTPRDNGERVVEGARHLAPYLGQRMRAGRVLDRSVFVRELLPQDLKLEIDAVDPDEAVTVAGYLAAVVGRAHGRQMSADDRKAWAKTLGEGRSKTLDAPSWLWRSVVDLMGSHEAAYLDHCRQFA
jgi:uncharacterized protein (DUF2252 family)